MTLHGSWNRSLRTGYEVVRLSFDSTGKPTGEYEDFMTGFVISDQQVWGRPVGVVRRTLAEKVADNHGTGSNSDADGEIALRVVELSDRGAHIDLDQIRLRHTTLLSDMRNERADDLARHCTDMMRKGESFPTEWEARLKRHPLIDGIPRQTFDGKRTVLEIRLITGELLIFDGDARRFSVR